jgi:DNA polymerase-3 subunit epsilon
MGERVRRVIVADTETTGLDKDTDQPLEVGWCELWGTASGLFVPPHTIEDADRESLELNGYWERIVHRPRDDAYSATAELHEALTGATLAGSSPDFDAAMLRRLFREADLYPEPFHHRYLPLESYAAGVLGLDPLNLPGLSDVCRLLGVVRSDRHTAWVDVMDAAQCFKRLIWKGMTP